MTAQPGLLGLVDGSIEATTRRFQVVLNDDAVAQLCARHPHRAELIAAYPARFADSLVGSVGDTVAILRELRETSVRLLALTNWPAESFRHARERFDFLACFEGIVVSGEERVAKPDPRIFAVLLERYDLDPAATLFIDDAQRNVAAAQHRGMHAVRFTTARELRRVLADVGVLPEGR